MSLESVIHIFHEMQYCTNLLPDPGRNSF